MTDDPTETLSPEAFDHQFRAQAASPLLKQLWSQAWGEQYPTEVAPSSGCPWDLLAHMIATLRPTPGHTLVDLGCGLGGPGLWLARATGTHLTGVDWSSTAVHIAHERSSQWLPADRVDFRTGSFTDTGLPDQHAHVVISVDALALAPDPAAALTEVHRILRPGGQLLFTAAEPHAALETPTETTWDAPLREAGFTPGPRHELPQEGRAWRRLYTSLRQNEQPLRAELGDRATETLLAEADMIEPYIDDLTWGSIAARA